MRPEVNQLLQMTGMQIGGIAAPTAYAQGSAQLMTGLLMISAAEYDRAAETRVADNAELRALFAELAPKVKDAGLKAQVQAAAATTDASLRISALNAANAELRKVLIALQTHVEDTNDCEAQKRVWSVLNASAQRRMLAVGLP